MVLTLVKCAIVTGLMVGYNEIWDRLLMDQRGREGR